MKWKWMRDPRITSVYPKWSSLLGSATSLVPFLFWWSCLNELIYFFTSTLQSPRVPRGSRSIFLQTALIVCIDDPGSQKTCLIFGYAEGARASAIISLEHLMESPRRWDGYRHRFPICELGRNQEDYELRFGPIPFRQRCWINLFKAKAHLLNVL